MIFRENVDEREKTLQLETLTRKKSKRSQRLNTTQENFREHKRKGSKILQLYVENQLSMMNKSNISLWLKMCIILYLYLSLNEGVNFLFNIYMIFDSKSKLVNYFICRRVRVSSQYFC